MYYRLLEVSDQATTEEIRQSYKQRCLSLHPDKRRDKGITEDNDELFKQVQEAWNTLKDEHLRCLYDARLKGTNSHYPCHSQYA